MILLFIGPVQPTSLVSSDSPDYDKSFLLQTRPKSSGTVMGVYLITAITFKKLNIHISAFKYKANMKHVHSHLFLKPNSLSLAKYVNHKITFTYIGICLVALEQNNIGIQELHKYNTPIEKFVQVSEQFKYPTKQKN